MAEQVSRTRLEVVADTSKARAEFSSLERAVSKFSSGVQTTFNAVTGFINKAGFALNFVGQAFDQAEFAVKFRELEASLPTGAIERFQAATGHTVAKMQLMQVAAKAMHGDLRLTQSGMETLLQAATNLGDKGFGETTQIAEKLTNALRTGNVKALQEYGIEIKSTGDKQKDFNLLLQKYRQLAADGGPENAQLQRFKEMQTKLADLMATFKVWLGEMVIKAVEWFGVILQGFKDAWDKFKGGVDYSDYDNTTDMMWSTARENVAREEGIPTMFSGAAEQDPEYKAKVVNAYLDQKEWMARNRATAARNRQAMETARIKTEEWNALVSSKGPMYAGTPPSSRDAATQPKSDLGPGWLGSDWTGMGMIGTEASRLGESAIGSAATKWNELSEGAGLGGMAGKGQDKAGKPVGFGNEWFKDATKELDAFHARLQDTGTIAGSAFQTASAAVGAITEAILSGQGGILKATRKAIAGQMKASGLQYQAKALGYAADALFTMNPAMWGAAAKAELAALAFFAGAAILGDGGASASSGAGAGAGARGAAGGGFTSSNSTRNTDPITVNIRIDGSLVAGDVQEMGVKISRAVKSSFRGNRDSAKSTAEFS